MKYAYDGAITIREEKERILKGRVTYGLIWKSING